MRLSFYSLNFLSHQAISLFGCVLAHFRIFDSLARLGVDESQTINLSQNLLFLLSQLSRLSFSPALRELNLRQAVLLRFDLAASLLSQALMFFLATAPSFV